MRCSLYVCVLCRGVCCLVCDVVRWRLLVFVGECYSVVVVVVGGVVVGDVLSLLFVVVVRWLLCCLLVVLVCCLRGVAVRCLLLRVGVG